MKKHLLFLLVLASCSTPYQNLHNSLDETLEIIDELYPEKQDPEKLRQAMINGIIQGADPHGAYLSEMQIKSLVESVDGGDLKLGMLIASHNSGLQAKKVFEKSAAYTAGIKDGDILIDFDAVPLKGIQLEEFLKLIKEKKAYPITILRNNQKLKKQITPGYFIPPSTELKWFKNIAYLKFGSINKEAGDEVQDQLKIIKSNKKLAGLILDLRDSPGGGFEAGIAIASQFLDGHVVVEMQKKSEFSKFSSAGPDLLNKLPIVVLQNKNTCSAAEIISAALKAHKRATLIGENTAGRATAKSVLQYPNSKDGLILTIAFLNDPLGKKIGKDGVEPDILAKEIKVQKNKKSDTYITEALRFLHSK